MTPATIGLQRMGCRKTWADVGADGNTGVTDVVGDGVAGDP